MSRRAINWTEERDLSWTGALRQIHLYPGHIYFIRAPKSRAIKIGYSKNPYRRFTNLRTGSAEPILRCEATLTKDFLRSTDPEREIRCRRDAGYTLDGKNLCAEHASLVLLRQAEAAGVIQPLTA